MDEGLRCGQEGSNGGDNTIGENAGDGTEHVTADFEARAGTRVFEAIGVYEGEAGKDEQARRF